MDLKESICFIAGIRQLYKAHAGVLAGVGGQTIFGFDAAEGVKLVLLSSLMLFSDEGFPSNAVISGMGRAVRELTLSVDK